MDEGWAWVALALVPGVGGDARRYARLLELGEPRAVLRASRAALAEAVGPAVAAALDGFDAVGAVEAQRRAADRVGARLVTLADPGYPAALRAVPDPPPFLLVRGTLLREDALGAAIVGSRRATAYGLRTAATLAGDLAVRGVTIVSGLARGVDTAAHRGALDAGGRTVAVLGSGVDVVYPPENRRLAEAVARAGAVVSQFPMGSPPLPAHFPARNRVIAGLTLGTVVVEAAERSGALITARLAGELGREVYAVPGPVSSPTSRGANRLIQDGAKLAGSWEDVVAEWPAPWRQAVRREPAVAAAGRAAAPGGAGPPAAGEQRLLAAVGDEPVAIDLLAARTGMPAAQVAAGLLTLELRGAVRQLPGQRYVRG